MKRILMVLILFPFFLAMPSYSLVPSEQARLAKGEVIVTTTARGFSSKFILEGNPAEIWEKLAEPNSWRKIFGFVLSAHEMKMVGKKDTLLRGQYRRYRNIYLKGSYRGRMLRMFFDAQISGSSPSKKGGSKTSTTSKPVSMVRSKGRSTGRPPMRRPSFFRGGSLTLSGPTNNISGSPFIKLSNFVKVNLSLRSTRMRVNGRSIMASQITIQVDLDYQKLFLADQRISLFRLDYRSSEFDGAIKMGLFQLANDFKSSL